MCRAEDYCWTTSLKGFDYRHMTKISLESARTIESDIKVKTIIKVVGGDGRHYVALI